MDVDTSELSAAMRPRGTEMRLVNARQARRALDHLAGFHVAPTHRRRMPRECTAAHVQYAALRLIREREAEIESFTSRAHWIVDAVCEARDGATFTARLSRLDGGAIGCTELESELAAQRVTRHIRGCELRIDAIDRTEVARDPAPPFTTSTLMQEAFGKLGFGVRKTIRTMQSLHEGAPLDGETKGLVTFMPADTVSLPRSSLGLARRILRGCLGNRYLPDNARKRCLRRTDAHGALEVIRPTDFARSPQAMADRIGTDAARLYELIWRRSLASQMAPARFDRIRVRLVSASRDVRLTAASSSTSFDGYLRMYREGREDAVEDGAQRWLPGIAVGAIVHVRDVRATKRTSRPPRRHTEASLVRKLGELGIGLPAAHAVVVDALQRSDFVALRDGLYVLRERGRNVMAFLEAFFAQWTADGCTVGLECDLDGAAGVGAAPTGVPRAFGAALEAALERTGVMERRDILAVIDGAWNQPRASTWSRLAPGSVASGSSAGPCAVLPFDGSGAPAHA